MGASSEGAGEGGAPARRQSAFAMYGGLLAVVVLTGGFIYGLTTCIDRMTAGAREVATELVRSVRAREMDRAYDLGSTDFRAAVSRGALGAYVEENAPDLRRATNAEVGEVYGAISVQCARIDLEGAGLHDDTVYLVAVEEGEHWKVRRFCQACEPPECESDPD